MSDDQQKPEMPEGAKQMERLMRLVLIIGAVGLLAYFLAGCASTGEAYANCAEGEERVRVGPRGQMPDYVCQPAV